MIWEIATLEVRAGEEAAFEAAVKAAAPHFQKARGCHGLVLERSIETPTRYFLRVKWETVEDHMVHFRNAPEFQEWRRLAGPFFTAPPSIEHSSLAGVMF